MASVHFEGGVKHMGTPIILSLNLILKRIRMHILLVLQMVITILLLVMIIGRIQFVNTSSQIARTFSGQNAYYFMPYQYINHEFNLTETLQQSSIDSFTIGEIGNLAFYDENQNIITSYGYNDVIIQSCNIDLDIGQWFTHTETTNVPAIAIGSQYSIGDLIYLQECLEGKTYTVEIIGILDWDKHILTFEKSASRGAATAEYLISNPVRSLIMPYDSSIYNSIAKPEQLDHLIFERSLANIVLLDKQQDMELAEELLLEYGHATSIDDMLVNYEKSINDELLIYSVICTVFSILTIVGIGGNNGIQNIINKYDFIIYYMLGATQKTCLLTEAIRSGIVIILSYVIAIMIYHLVPTLFPISTYHITLQTWTVILIFLLVIYAITSGVFLYRLSKNNLISSYKESLKGKI